MVVTRLARASIVTAALVLAGVVAALALRTPLPETAQAVHAAPADSAPPARIALLVGIDKYDPSSPKELAPLRGCVNDVHRMQALLVDRFGFAPGDVKVLVDEQATASGIVRAFQDQLIARAGPETQAFFFFAGHGSRVPDLATGEGREEDGLDSTYVAFDSRAHGATGEHDLSDDLLGSLVASLSERAAFVTVVTDSCHSGGGLRGDGPRVRAAPAGTKPVDLAWARSFWPTSVQLRDDPELGRLRDDKHIHVAACRRDEQAHELDPGRDVALFEPHGALTWFLAGVLDGARPDETWRSARDEVQARVASAFGGQTVTGAGALDRKILGGGFRALPGYAASVRKNGVVCIEAGQLFGLRTGSTLEVRDARGVEVLGQARVDRVDVANAVASWTEPKDPAALAGAVRVLEIARPEGQEPLFVRVGDERLRRRLEACTLVRLASGAETNADYELETTPTSSWKLTTRESLLVAQGASADADEMARAVEDAFRSELRWRALSALALQPSRLPLAVRFQPATDEECAHELEKSMAAARESGTEPRFSRFLAPRVAAASQGRGAGLRGEQAVWVGGFEDATEIPLGYLEVENPHDQALFVNILSVAEDRARTPISERRRIEAHGKDRVPFGLAARHEWPLARPMRDRYVVVATIQDVDLGPLATGSVLRGSDEQLPWVLREAFDAAPVRGRPVILSAGRNGEAGFGISVVDLLVAKPD